jgi:hypothetical protein
MRIFPPLTGSRQFSSLLFTRLRVLTKKPKQANRGKQMYPAASILEQCRFALQQMARLRPVMSEFREAAGQA